MKLYLINPNTSQFVTDKVAECARAFAGEATEIIAKTGKIGPAIVGTRAECALAATETLRMASEIGEDCDGILLAISFDTGLDALREILDVPVIGMSEAGMLAAMTVSRKFSLLTFGDRAAPIYSELVSHYGFDKRCSGVIALPALTQEELENTALIIPALCERIDRAAEEDGAEAVVLAGAVFAGIAREIADEVSIPIIDGIAAGVGLLETMHMLRPKKPQKGSYRYPLQKSLTGVSPALVHKFKTF